MSDRPSLRRVEAFLGEIVAKGVASSVVGLIATAEEIVWEGAAGEARAGAPAEIATRFDYASLTKPFMATLALTLDAGGVLPLAAPIADLWPQAHRALARRPLSDLLRHRSCSLEQSCDSGYPTLHTPYFVRPRSQQTIYVQFSRLSSRWQAPPRRLCASNSSR